MAWKTHPAENPFSSLLTSHIPIFDVDITAGLTRAFVKARLLINMSFCSALPFRLVHILDLEVVVEISTCFELQYSIATLCLSLHAQLRASGFVPLRFVIFISVRKHIVPFSVHFLAQCIARCIGVLPARAAQTC